ncbi:TRAP transporter large permease [Paracoccus albus]|uniref:TRAP transporter large permease n=1 Tax=Paracoccus albus TaxID=3017784 RepID=UPI0022F128B1|nr:TRAP transporter large permease subunit [Paracoccus albus]WBU60875.1 TRAP transporter large permease subunit [Paracoccus albus]
MTLASSSLILMAMVVVFLGSGIWIFAGLTMIGVGSLYFIHEFDLARIGSIASKVIASSAVSWELAAIPIFVWMGDMIFRTDLSQRLFRGLSPLVSRIPGGLLHTNVIGCTIFAAISGSSNATTATVGKITIPELMKRGYNTDLASGSLAGAGTFGLLIPPSIAMIIYGVLAEVSIVKLFAAGVVPGVMMAVLYSGYIILVSLLKPGIEPADRQPASLAEMAQGLWELFPILLLMTLVLGSIYTGLATPSEAAAVGVAVTLVIVLVTRQFSFAMISASLMATIRISAMICILIATASFLSAALAFMHLPVMITESITTMELSPLGLLAILALLYILLGMFIDGTSMTVMTVPIAVPLIVQAGFDPIWFGVFLVIMIELSALTPPVGLNLYILQGLTSQGLGRTVRAALPFFILLCFGTLLLVAFPQIVLWLPNML